MLELQRRGHELHVRTLASAVEEVVALGIDAAPIASAIEAREMDDWKARTPIGSITRALTCFLDRAELEIADVRAAIEEVRPDLLLIDVNSWGGACVAESSGLPWANWSPFPLPIESRHLPPWGPGLRPRRGTLWRLRDAALRRVVSGRYNSVVRERLNGIREREGLPRLENATEALVRAPLTLHQTAEPFEYPHPDWPASVRNVGPDAWDPPAQAPEWADESEAPLVLVTLSTEFLDDRKLAETALEALAAEPVRVVVTTAAVDPAGLTVPPNARVERFLPHRPLLERAAVVVCHTGMGITQKALSMGVPVVAVPFGRDQFEVARRVEMAGAGVRLPATRLNARRLRAAVVRAIPMRTGASRVAAGFHAAGGARASADAIEELVAREGRGVSTGPVRQRTSTD